MFFPDEISFFAHLQRTAMTKNGTRWSFVRIIGEPALLLAMRGAEMKRGFQSVKVSVQIGATEWQTSAFKESRADAAGVSYFLPIKACVRKAERIDNGDEILIRLRY